MTGLDSKQRRHPWPEKFRLSSEPNIWRIGSNQGSREIIAVQGTRDVDFRWDAGIKPLRPEHKRYLTGMFGVEPLSFAQARQVHENSVVRWPMSELGIPEADAIITHSTRAALLIRTADCLPVFLMDPEGMSAGMVHAGWRGTRERIVMRTIETMRDAYGTRPSDLSVVLGPCVRQENYEVDSSFSDIFPDSVAIREGRVFFDLAGENRRQLLEVGVLSENIFDSGVDTRSCDRYFSHRGGDRGRQVSAVIII